MVLFDDGPEEAARSLPLVRWRSLFREVDPPTVVKSGKAEGHTTTWTSRLRLFSADDFFMVNRNGA